MSADPHPDAELLALGDVLSLRWEKQKQIEAKEDHEDAALDEAMKAVSRIVDEIEHARATTVEGLRVKAMAVSWCASGGVLFDSDRPASTDVRLVRSMVKDLA